MRLLSLLFATTLCDLAIAAASDDVSYLGVLMPLNITPTFDKGYLFAYDAHKVDVFGPDGSLLFGISAQVPNAKVINIQNAAADSDGTIAGAVEYSLDQSVNTETVGIAVFDRSGKQVRFFGTGDYFPTQVAFGPDHSIWTLGWPGPRARHWNGDFCVLRNYSQEGQELGRFLPRSSFDPEPAPVGPMIGMWQLRVAADRIGAMIYESSVYEEGQNIQPSITWVETDLKGKELGRLDMGRGDAAEAFTESAAIYTREGKSVSVFDRAGKTWRRVPISGSGHLLGADGATA